MKALLPLFIALVLPVASALGFDEALQAAPSRPDAVNARLELLAAQNDLLRVQGDPLALKMDQVKAEQAVRLGRATLHKAIADALVDIAGAYTGVLEAREGAKLADEGAALSQTSLRIAGIRRDNGTGTELDVQDAQVSFDKAKQDAAKAHKGLSVALNNLQGMIGVDVEANDLDVIPDTFLVDVPSLETVLAGLPNHPQLLQASQGLALAKLGVDMLDPSYASASQIESARTQVLTTEQLVQEASRGFALQARNLVIQAQSAAEGYAIALADVDNAEQRLAFQQDRFSSGLIAQVVLDQAKLQAGQAQLAALTARDSVFKSLLAVQAGTLAPLAGPSVWNAEAALPPLEDDHATN